MPSTFTPVTLADLTSATLTGSGVFDVLMRANKVHLEAEFTKNRIKGPEYATVYLGSLTQVMQTAMQFLLTNQKNALEAELLQQQILLAQIEVSKASATLAQIQAQTSLIGQQTAMIVAEGLNVPKLGAKIDADTAMTTQQRSNLIEETYLTRAKVTELSQQTTNLLAEAANIPKLGAKIDSDKLLTDQQRLNVVEEILLTQAKVTQAAQQTSNLAAEEQNLSKTGLKIDADRLMTEQQKLNLINEALLTVAKTSLTGQQTTNLTAEAANIPKQGLLIDANKNQEIQKTLLTLQQTTNSVTEGLVLTATKCKLDAEFDVLEETKLKVAQETALLLQKVNTEKAQTLATGVDDNSVIGRQKQLYVGQTNGFARDAEQKAAKIMVDSWSTRRATDTDTPVDNAVLDNPSVGRAVTKLLAGISA
jgi:hypothetical protein